MSFHLVAGRYTNSLVSILKPIGDDSFKLNENVQMTYIRKL